MRYRFTLLALVTLPIACADPCVDDGVDQENKGACPGQASASASATDDATGSATGSATETDSQSATNTDSMGSNDGNTATETMDATETADSTDSDEGGPGCMNGVKDGDESDVDCGGSCPKCDDGKICQTSEDCVSDACTTAEICDGSNSCTELIDDNGCQACIKANCCEAVEECFMDEFCHCWVECIEKNNDFDPCVQECMGTMKPGAITSCANSDCGHEGACG